MEKDYLPELALDVASTCMMQMKLNQYDHSASY